MLPSNEFAANKKFCFILLGFFFFQSFLNFGIADKRLWTCTNFKKLSQKEKQSYFIQINCEKHSYSNNDINNNYYSTQNNGITILGRLY